jgi:hypothetical protein
MARLVLGSTGEALLHDARCPILVAPRPTTEPAATPFAIFGDSSQCYGRQSPARAGGTCVTSWWAVQYE